MKEYHLKGTSRDDPDNWLTKVQLDFDGKQIGVHTDDERTIGEGTAAATPVSQGQSQANRPTSSTDAGPEPEFWGAFTSQEWPPMTTETYEGTDSFGDPVTRKRQVFDWERKDAYDKWLRGETEKAEKAEKERVKAEKERVKEEESAQAKAAKEQESKARMSAEPRFYQDPETGQRYIQKASGDWEVDEAASESIAQQQATQPKRPSSLVGLMAEALDSGNIERARGLWDFENQVTPLQYLQLTMEYADNPEALKVLFDFVQARRPGIIGGQGQGPVTGQSSPSQQAGFAPGSYTARSFDAQDPATQQQYLLRQQYIKAGGVPQTSSPFQNPTEAVASLQARYPDAPFGPLQEEALRLTGQGQPFTRPTGALSAQPGGEVDLPDWTEPQDPRLSGDTDQDREGLTAARPAGGRPVDNSTWEGFMSGFKPFADTPGQEAAMAKNLAAGNPYAGRVMATDPVTGKWTNWVDQQSGQVFMEIPGGGLSATETFNPVTPKPAATPSPFNPVDLEGYLKAAQTLSASKKPKQRSPFGAPVFVPRR